MLKWRHPKIIYLASVRHPPMSEIFADALVDGEPKKSFEADGFEDLPNCLKFFMFRALMHQDDDAMLLDPPDPVDLLIAHTHADEAVNLGARPHTSAEDWQQIRVPTLAFRCDVLGRPLDFVRAKVSELKKENKKLKDRRPSVLAASVAACHFSDGEAHSFIAYLHGRVADLEQTLSIVQTAQEWTLGKGRM